MSSTFQFDHSFRFCKMSKIFQFFSLRSVFGHQNENFCRICTPEHIIYFGNPVEFLGQILKSYFHFSFPFWQSYGNPQQSAIQRKPIAFWQSKAHHNFGNPVEIPSNRQSKAHHFFGNPMKFPSIKFHLTFPFWQSYENPQQSAILWKSLSIGNPKLINILAILWNSPVS